MRNGKWAAAAAALVVSTVVLWAPLAGALAFGTDELELLAVSREIGNGAWRKLLAPQDVHLVPLYRLARLYFDWRFPAGVALAVGVGGAVEALARRRRRATAVALAAAARLYYGQQHRFLTGVAARLQQSDFATPRFMERWDRSIEQALERAGPEGLRLPWVQLKRWFSLAEFVAVTRPAGDPRIRLLRRNETRLEDCLRFWSEMAGGPAVACQPGAAGP
jgi:hypothetical protein